MLLSCLIAAFALAAAAPTATRLLGRNTGWLLAAGLLGVAVPLAATAVDGANDQVVPWMPTLGIDLALRLDGLGLVFAMLVLLVGAAVLAYSSRYLKPGRHASFFGLMALFAASMLLLVLSDDVVVMFVAWEATTLCSFFLISRSGEGAREPAIRTLLVTALGGLALLAAVVTMAVATGTTRLSAILADEIWSRDGAFTTVVAVLLAIAAFTKSAQFPFQAWLPDSMVAITPVSAYLHAAAMVKAGIYLLLRFSPAVGQEVVWSALLISAGLITSIIGALAALRRHDLKELLAYSTMSQLGLLVATIGVGTPEALAAGVIHTIAHALFKAALFMLVGVVDVQAGTRDIRRLTDLRRRMPVTFTLTAVAAASMAGVPPLLGFLSKESLLDAFWEAPGPDLLGPVLAVVVALVAVLTFAYSARIVLDGFGPLRPGLALSDVDADDESSPVEPPHEARPTFWGPVALPALAGVALGVVPFVLDGLVSGAASAASGTAQEEHLSLWHGVNPALVLSVIVLVTGTALALGRERVDRALARARLPFSALAVVDGARAGLIRLGALVGRPTATSAPRRHLLIPAVCLTLIAGAALAVGGLDLPARVPGDVAATDAGLLALVVAGTVSAVLARTRIGAVVVTGVVGFAMTAWFFTLGAADVALTQLLVEILTVVVMVLLLRRLPYRFRREPRRGAVLPAVVAIAAGAATTLGVWALTGRRGLSPAGEWYVTQGEAETGGANVVNTILVDFRALDTLGELTVLGVAGVTILVLLRARRELPPREPEPAVDTSSPLADAGANAVFTRTLTRAVGPLTVLLSAVLLLRGHQEPGGGFIAALMGGAGVALVYLAAPSDRAARIRAPTSCSSARASSWPRASGSSVWSRARSSPR
ncbi:DUF4040 family protein [Litorihabitans aurantiacus]|uniref:Monovalent cation/H+ antiporter subunit A n=1 Tax=Litorihabitans aurantiacus TaxID=1930061 RepID=A0AA37XHC5_9MICO|nr:DUF4040 family protein [Litorihabitans aurantiacus]GMA32989.1 monovalent cation/H+ antiporter subunit A [Litorihabitans aurantiacus]